MFFVYSYFVEYFGWVFYMNGIWVSFMLMMFGVIMIVGNFVFGVLLYKNMKKIVIVFLFFYMVVYLFIYGFGMFFVLMVVFVFVWGVVYFGGFIVS